MGLQGPVKELKGLPRTNPSTQQSAGFRQKLILDISLLLFPTNPDDFWSFGWVPWGVSPLAVRGLWWSLLTESRFCLVGSWAAECPSGPHHHTLLWLGHAACSAPWTSLPSSDSCQRSDPDSFCCSGSTATVRPADTTHAALSWWTGILFAPRSFQVISSVSRCPPTRQSPTCDRVRISCPAGHLLSSRHLCSGTSRMTKPEEHVHMEGCDAPCYHSVRNGSLRCGMHRKLSKSGQTLLRHIISKRRTTQTWLIFRKKKKDGS